VGVTGQPALSFAGLLRQPRAEAWLTQEELAETASLSPRSVSDLERGVNRTARKSTALLLADALSLAEPVRALFVAAARDKARPLRCWRPGGGGAGEHSRRRQPRLCHVTSPASPRNSLYVQGARWPQSWLMPPCCQGRRTNLW
jgi:DNA-binding XRE family transcriptional regulator